MLRYLRSRIGSSYQVKSDHFDDFVDFSKLTTHGFPQKASSMSVDEQLGYIAIGTKDGRLLIFCSNGAQHLSANFGSKLPICALYFVAGANTLLIQCNDSSTNAQHFVRCQITSDQLTVTHLNNERHLKRITCCEMVGLADGQSALLIGTIIGNIYALLVRNMELTEHVVFLDTALKDISEFDSQQKQVNGVNVHSEDQSKLYILFNNSFVVFYDITSDEVLQTFKSETPITFMSTISSLTKLLCSHADGAYSFLGVSEKGFEIERKRPFGTKKCTKITKIISSKSPNSCDEFVIFAGGVPLDELDNRFTLSVFCADKSLILDFDSAILDFCVFCANDNSSHILFVLCEDEIVAIDLLDPIWRMLPLPFLHPIHSSPVTCVTTVNSLSEKAQTLLGRLANLQRNASNIFSRSNLTLKNGQIAQRRRINNTNAANDLQLVVTGHENGVINVWLASEFSFKPWISLNTARDFEGFIDDSAPNLLQNSNEELTRKEPADANSDENNANFCLPPVRKAGLFDPYSDDHRLAVQKVFVDSQSGEIAVGGRAGQLLVYEGLPNSKKDMPRNEVLLLDMTSSEDAAHLRLTGHLPSESPIQARNVPANYPPGFCLLKNTVVQFKPAVPVTSIAWDSQLEVLAAGNEFGYAICCPGRREVLLIKTLIPSTDVMQLSSMDGPLSRFKSVKKSIRQSFRKRRRPNEEMTIKNFRPAEREIAQRPVNPNILSGQTPTSLVKVVTFHQCDVSSSSSDCDSRHLFVGTHGSVVFIHAFHPSLSSPCSSSVSHASDHRSLQCPLVKEIRLQHQAPIVGILYAAEGSNPTGAGRLFVLTEEQIRTFTVPGLRPSTKLRFTAAEGSRIKKPAIVQLRSRLRRARSPEKFVVFSTNRAELFLIPTNSNLKRQYRVQFSEHSDSTAIVSATLSSDGQLFFLRPGGSEFERCSLDNKFFNK